MKKYIFVVVKVQRIIFLCCVASPRYILLYSCYILQEIGEKSWNIQEICNGHFILVSKMLLYSPKKTKPLVISNF